MVMKLKKENKQTTEAAERLAEHCIKNLSYGDTLTYEVVAQLTGMTRDNKYWQSFKSKLFKKLRKSKGWCFHAVNNVGYRLLTPGETVTEQMAYRGRKSISQSRMAKAEAGAVNDGELSAMHRDAKYKMVDYHNRVRKQAMRANRIARAFMGGK